MTYRLLAAAIFSIVLSVHATAGEAEDAKAAFESAYELGAAAAIEKKWAVAEKNFEAALKVLGNHAHPKKAVAQVLLNKARESAKQEAAQQEMLLTADELLKLKQWPEAEAAYKKAAETLGETEAIRKGIAAAQAGANAEKNASVPALKAEQEMKEKFERKIADAAEFLKNGQYDKADQALHEADLLKPNSPEAAALHKIVDEKVAQASAAKAKADAESKAASAPKPKAEEKEPAPLEVPEPVALDRDDWQRGAGSQCYWAGERLHLENGDEFYKKILTKDFAATILLEAQMDHRSRIGIELRPPKDSGFKSKIIGWGSREGSPPQLAVDKDIKSSGEKQPPREQITLSFVRTGRKVEFYCDGKLIGHTWTERLDQPLVLWVCGKGIMDGARVVER